MKSATTHKRKPRANPRAQSFKIVEERLKRVSKMGILVRHAFDEAKGEKLLWVGLSKAGMNKNMYFPVGTPVQAIVRRISLDAGDLIHHRATLRKNPEMSAGPVPEIYSSRVRLRGYNGPQSVFTAHGRDGGKIAKVLFPGYGKREHLSISRDYALASEKAGNLYAHALDQAAMRLWGRPFQVTDYRVSGIGSDRFSESDKALLRKLVREKQQYKDISRAHYYAAGKR